MSKRVLTAAENALAESTRLRAKAYVYILEELSKAVGEQAAQKICAKALHRLGSEIAGDIRKRVKSSSINIDKLSEMLVKAPEHALVNKKKAILRKEDLVQIQFDQCLLVQTWREMGLDDKKINMMCDLSRNIDRGIAESLGHRVNYPALIARGAHSCIMEISGGKTAFKERP